MTETRGTAGRWSAVPTGLLLGHLARQERLEDGLSVRIRAAQDRIEEIVAELRTREGSGYDD